jgi:hypothetical protein
MLAWLPTLAGRGRDRYHEAFADPGYVRLESARRRFAGQCLWPAASERVGMGSHWLTNKRPVMPLPVRLILDRADQESGSPTTSA